MLRRTQRRRCWAEARTAHPTATPSFGRAAHHGERDRRLLLRAVDGIGVLQDDEQDHAAAVDEEREEEELLAHLKAEE